MPVTSRSELKNKFQRGLIPSQQDFENLIESVINPNDDNLKKMPNTPLQIGSSNTADNLQKMIEFFRGAVSGNGVWSVGLSAGAGKPGLAVMQGAANRLFIQEGTGNVGIGSESPKMSLQVDSPSLHNAPAIGGYRAGQNNHNGWLYMHVVSNVNAEHAIIWDDKRSLRFGVETGMGEGGGFRNLARITKDGNFGIGSEIPVYTFQVQKSVGDWLTKFENTNAPAGSSIFFSHHNGSGMCIYTGSDAAYGLFVGKTTNRADFFVNGNGNVGIGTSTPQAKFVIDPKDENGIPYTTLLDNGLIELAKFQYNGGFSYFESNFHHRLRVKGGVVFNLGDFTELFESENQSVILIGTSVVLTQKGTIRPAKKSEVPVGIISVAPAIICNNADEWPQKHLTNEFGQTLTEEVEEDIITPDGKTERVKVQKPILNPEYDPNREYIPRNHRPEWHPVGLLGQLHLRKGQPVAPSWVKIKDVSENVELWLVK